MKFGNLFFHGKRSRKIVALTFDDSPAEETQNLLKLLNKEKVKATFFILGKRIKERERVINNIILEGHEIGNHSYSHTPLWFRSVNFIEDEILRCDKALMNKFDISTNLFRPPYFKFGLSCWLATIRLKKKVIFCDVVSNDWKCKGIRWTASHAVKKVKPGSIINLHDYLEGIGRNKDIVAITSNIIKELKHRGYKFGTVSNVLNL